MRAIWIKHNTCNTHSQRKQQHFFALHVILIKINEWNTCSSSGKRFWRVIVLKEFFCANKSLTKKGNTDVFDWIKTSASVWLSSLRCSNLTSSSKKKCLPPSINILGRRLMFIGFGLCACLAMIYSAINCWNWNHRYTNLHHEKTIEIVHRDITHFFLDFVIESNSQFTQQYCNEAVCDGYMNGGV